MTMIGMTPAWRLHLRDRVRGVDGLTSRVVGSKRHKDEGGVEITFLRAPGGGKHEIRTEWLAYEDELAVLI